MGFGDDAAGPCVIEHLEGRGVAARLATAPPDPATLADLWAGKREAILVDCCRATAAPGTIVERDLIAEPLPAAATRAGHGFTLETALPLAALLHPPPASLHLLAIVGEVFDRDIPMSAAVSKACRTVADRIARSPTAQGAIL